jgi:hypothetical protein
MDKKLSVIALVLLLCAPLALVSLPSQSAHAVTIPAWDFEDHSLTHTSIPDMTGPGQLESELLAMNNLFANYGLPAPRHYDYPNGAYLSEAVPTIAQYRDTARSSGSAPFPNVYGATDWYQMGAANIERDKTVADVKAWIDTAISQKALAILYTHDVTENPTTYGTTPEVLQGVVDYLVAQQNAGALSVMTMRQAYSSFNGQKAIVVMAFDDGSITDYTTVWPMFKAVGLAGTSYIVGNYVGSQQNSLTWDKIQEMAQVGPYAPAPTPTPPNGPTAWGAFMEVSPAEGGTTNFGRGSVIVLSGDFYANATPAAGYVFDHWFFKDANYTDSLMLFPQQPYGTVVTITAVFRPANVTPPTPWSLNVTTKGLGVTTPTGLVNVTSGSIRVNATANVNSTFSYWQFDNANITSAFNVTSNNTTNSIVIPAQTLGSNHTLTAIFANTSISSVWHLTVNVNGSVGGTTTPSGTLNVTSGSITVNATATANYTFSQWRLDNITLANTTSVTIPQQAAGSNHTLTAYFVRSVSPAIATVTLNSKP